MIDDPNLNAVSHPTRGWLNARVVDNTDGAVRVVLTIGHTLGRALQDGRLHLTIFRHVDAAACEGLRLESHIGSHCRFALERAVPARGELAVTLVMACEPMRHVTDLPLAAYLAEAETALTIPLTVRREPPPGELAPAEPLPAAAELGLIPWPAAIERDAGDYHLQPAAGVTVRSPAATAAAGWLCEALGTHTGEMPPRRATAPVCFAADEACAGGGYGLVVATDGVTLTAADGEGFRNAVATLLQLLPAATDGRPEGGWRLPRVRIADVPRFPHRGLMLDCGRHFHPVPRILRLLEHMARLKLNVFHWHLTDDEGWRLEIDAWPALTQRGGWRGEGEVQPGQYFSGAERHGGSYSRADVAAVVERAQALGITVIPEIDLPGHCRAALRALPEVLADEDDRSEYRSVQNYPDNVLSPALPGTWRLLEDVIDQVCEQFPAPWVHVGCDEVPEGAWSGSPRCRALMERLGFTDARELQGYMMGRLQAMLAARGRGLMGWEEAMHGDALARGAVVFPWTGEAAGLEAVRKGFDVVLQPGEYAYLDLAQSRDPAEPGLWWAGELPLDRVHGWQPLADVPEDAPERQHIRGVQAALWSELIPTRARMDYMLFPRLAALAEVGWCRGDRRSLADFRARWRRWRAQLDRLGVNYHRG